MATESSFVTLVPNEEKTENFQEICFNLKKEAVYSSEKLLIIYQTGRYRNPYDYNIDISHVLQQIDISTNVK